MDMDYDFRDGLNPLEMLEIQVEQDDDPIEFPIITEEDENRARMEAFRLAITSPFKDAELWRHILSKNNELTITVNGQSPFITNRRGRPIPVRHIGPRCSCNRNCRTLMQGTETEIFRSFWNLGDFNSQNAYLYSCIRALKPKRAYLHKRTKADTSRRENTFQYYVKVNGIDIRICKQEFAAIHGLQNSYGRIKNIQRMLTTGKGGPKREGRGKPTLIQKNHIADINST